MGQMRILAGRALLLMNVRFSIRAILFSLFSVVTILPTSNVLARGDSDYGTANDAGYSGKMTVYERNILSNRAKKRKLIKLAVGMFIPGMQFAKIAYYGYSTETSHIRSTGNSFDELAGLFTLHELERARDYPDTLNINDPLYLYSSASWLRYYRNQMLKEHRVNRKRSLEFFGTPALLFFGLSGYFSYRVGKQSVYNNGQNTGGLMGAGENISGDLVLLPGENGQGMIGFMLKYTF